MQSNNGITAVSGLGKFVLSFIGTIFKDAGITNGQVLTRGHDWRHEYFESFRSYPVVMRGRLDGMDASREVDCDWIDSTYAADDAVQWKNWIDLHRSNELERIMSNTAERGFDIAADFDKPAKWPNKIAPATHVGRFLVTLRARMEDGLPAVPYYPLELGENNAASFLEAFKALLSNWATASSDWAMFHDDLLEYLEAGGVHQTLVDQIVPDFVRNLKDYPHLPGVYERYDTNPMAVVTEPYREWVIEGSPWIDLPGVVEFTDDPTPYTRRKLGLLNLPDVLKVAWGLKKGWDLEKTFKWEAFADDDCRAWLDRIVAEEISPAIADDIPGEAETYWAAVSDRYRSKAIPYTLAKVYGDPEVFATKIDQRAGFVAREYRAKVGGSPVELQILIDSVGAPQ
jgi:mannitol-1-phosphate/altronate dehydrogenase